MMLSTLPDTLIEFISRLKEYGVEEKDYEKYVGDYLEQSARRKGIPFHGQFELTPLCNLDCKMCYVHLNNEQFAHSSLLDVSTWNSIIDEAYNCGMRKASLTGGECLTYPGFDDIYLHLEEKRIPVGVLTNGILLTSERINFFKLHPPRHIQISIYGSNDDAYESVTGRRVFRTVRDNIFAIRDVGIPLKISITPSRFMYKDLYALIKLVDSWGIKYGINSRLTTPRGNTERNNEDMTLDQYIDMFKIRNELKNWEGLEPVDPEEMPEEGQGSCNEIGLKCGAGRSCFVMKHNGWICPCVELDEIEANAVENGFKAAWEYINYQVNNYILPAECNGCFYQKICPKCAGMHKDYPGHCNPHVCERTKRLVQEGLTPMPKQITE